MASVLRLRQTCVVVLAPPGGPQEQVAQLLVERSELLHRMAQQEQELAQAQQALHDVRAELLMVHQEQQAQEQQREARSNATDEDGQPAGDGEHAGEVEGEAGPVAAQGEAGQGEEGARGEGEGAGPEASPSQVRNAGGLRTAAVRREQFREQGHAACSSGLPCTTSRRNERLSQWYRFSYAQRPY